MGTPVEESAHIETLDDAEVIFKQRPIELFIEVSTATKKMPIIHGKPVYTLHVLAKQWSLDSAGKIKIQRCVFPVVLDFGGTAHAYCGSTTEVALSDLLSWTHKLSLEDMLNVDIMKPRARGR